MGRIRKITFILMIFILLFAPGCSNEKERLESPSPSVAEPVSTSTDVKIAGEEAVESVISFDRFEAAAERAEEVSGANLTNLTPVMVSFNYDSGATDSYTLFLDTKNTVVWLLHDQSCRKFSDEDSRTLLADASFDSLYLSDVMEITAAFEGEPIPLSEYGIETKAGKTMDGRAEESAIPEIEMEKVEDFIPTFSAEPDRYTVTVVDREGAIPDEYLPDEYYCEIEAEYSENAWRGTLRYSAKLIVVGEPELVLSANEVAQGRVIVVEVKNMLDNVKYEVYLPHIQKTARVYDLGERQIALIQANITAEPGGYTLELRRMLNNGKYIAATATADYTITATEFKRQDLITTEETQSIFNDDNLKKDQEKVDAARANSNATPYWSGVFIKPVEGPITTQFGQARYVNQKLQSLHTGVDIAAAAGSEVLAPASGKVVFAGELIVNGNTVILDHGMNVFSSYSHLSEISVQTGDMVAPRDVIGLVGSTGYSTGPHLHYTVMVNGYYIDPVLLETDDILFMAE